MRWKPDTCDCWLEYDFNHEGTVRTSEQFENVKVLKTCERHKNAQTAIDTHMAAQNDNWLRNDARKIIQSALGKDSEPQYYRKIKDSFDANGVIHITIDDRDATPNLESDAQSYLDLQLGQGKVVID